MPKNPSIRDHLESDAWRNHPQFAEQRSRLHPETPDRRPLRWEDRALLILATVLMLLLIVRVETAHADDFWGVEFIEQNRVDQSMALNTSIKAEITGLVARIDVTQVFENNGPDWAEAVYRFPLPEGAAVDRMLVEVGDRLLEGEIREKEEARREYARARASGKLASLVEQQHANQFKTRLANIAAGETIRVSISFLAHIDYRDGTYGLQIPMTFTPRWDPHTPAGDRGMGRLHRFLRAEDSDGHYLELDIRLNTGLKLASLESRYHDIDIHPTLNGYQLYLADPDTRTDSSSRGRDSESRGGGRIIAAGRRCQHWNWRRNRVHRRGVRAGANTHRRALRGDQTPARDGRPRFDHRGDRERLDSYLQPH